MPAPTREKMSNKTFPPDCCKNLIIVFTILQYAIVLIKTAYREERGDVNSLCRGAIDCAPLVSRDGRQPGDAPTKRRPARQLRVIVRASPCGRPSLKLDAYQAQSIAPLHL